MIVVIRYLYIRKKQRTRSKERKTVPGTYLPQTTLSTTSSLRGPAQKNKAEPESKTGAQTHDENKKKNVKRANTTSETF